MPCGEHTCPKSCHPLLCGSCEVTELAKCYCGNEMKEIKCCDKEYPRESSRIHENSDDEYSDDDELDEWTGYYECGKICDRFVPTPPLSRAYTKCYLGYLSAVSIDAGRDVTLRTLLMGSALMIHNSSRTVLVVKYRLPIYCLSHGRIVKHPSRPVRKCAIKPFHAAIRVRKSVMMENAVSAYGNWR